MSVYTCSVCNEEFTSYNPNPQFCSQACRTKSMRFDVDVADIRRRYEAGETQDEIAAALGLRQQFIQKLMKREGIGARKAAKRDQRGEKNVSWKGDEATYKGFHDRVRYSRGKAKDHGCSVCGTTDPRKNYDWANLTGNYPNVNDYTPMCRSCHRKFDKSKDET